MEKIRKIIEKYNLTPHPEGGWFREIYRSEQKVISSVNHKERASVTQIYFLLEKGQVSRFHKVLHDEIWTFFEGDPLKIIKYDSFSRKDEKEKIEADIIGGDSGNFISIIKGGIFQAAETLGDYTLVGCSVSPGFEFEDFSFLSDYKPLKEDFLENYPDYKKFI